MKAGKYDFEELTLHYLGSTGYYLATVFMFLLAYGAQVAYMVIIGDTIPVVLRSSYQHEEGESSAASSDYLRSREFIMLAFGTVIVLPLCLLKHMSSLAATSSLSVLSDVVLVMIVVGCSFQEAR